MGNIKNFNEFFNLNNNVDKIQEGSVAEPTVRPTVKPGIKPGIKQTPGRPSPLRRDKPSVTPAPKAMTDIELSNKFLEMTKNNKDVQHLLRKKYKK